MKILIVDDEPAIVARLWEILEQWGYTNLRTTTDPQLVGSLLRESEPDLLLLDLRMPMLDGFGVMAQLASSVPSDRCFPVLVLTADADADTKRRALLAGATDFLIKPFDEADVVFRITNLLKARLLHQQLQEQNASRDLFVQERTASLQTALADLKATQRQLIQQERLSALRTMAAGMGRDFRNALTPILGYTELLLQSIKTADRETAAKHLQIIFTAARDAARIVAHLREFHRSPEETEIRTAINLNELLDEAATMSSPKWKTPAIAAGVTNELTIRRGEIEQISGDRAELCEVVAKLIFNAVDAMPSGGTINLSTAQVGGRVIFEVHDTGSGMTEEVRQQCIEPFFTTKGTERTGLGLSTVYGIVERHQGSLAITSELGIGTTVSLSFPALSGGAFAESPVSPEVNRPLSVLVVDDQPLLCTLLSEYLRQDKHTVETANGGYEALEKFRGRSFDLVIVDRVMPDMGGDELAAAIKALALDQPVLMVTGFSGGPRLSYGPDAILSKPISMASLRDGIRRALNHRGDR